MMTNNIHTLCALSILVVLSTGASAFDIFAVDPSGATQLAPAVDNGKIVWQEEYTQGQVSDWDIYGIDLFADPEPATIYIAAYNDDQQNPCVWNNYVAWQDNEPGHWDIWLTDITDPTNPVPYHISPYENDQTAPSLHGNTVTWQHQYATDDWDIFAADVTDPNHAMVYPVDEFENSNQLNPAIFRDTIVYEDASTGHSDILSADVWLRNAIEYTWILSDPESKPQLNPAISDDMIVWQSESTVGNFDIYAARIDHPHEVQLVVSTPGNQLHPDISGHLVIWQDNRNGNWDIYGYNLITGQEFRITHDPADQTQPAISGSLAVWEDMRDGVSTIYAAWLEGDVIANCENPPAGDIDGNCNVDLLDLIKIAESWLKCGLEPASACRG